MSAKKIHILKQMVRFEDVDAAAIVYHPVYLNYLERARSQCLLDNNYSFKKVIELGLGIVVASVQMKYIRPLMLEDNFFIATQVDKQARSIIYMTQVIAKNEEDLKRDSLKDELRQIKTIHFYAHLTLTVVSATTKRPTAIPQQLAHAL